MPRVRSLAALLALTFIGVAALAASLKVRQAPLPPSAARKPLLLTAPPAYGPLQERLRAFLVARPGVAFGIYFKDLQSGAEFGIDADRPLPAASTVKVPLVLYLNRLVAEGRTDFAERVAYHPETDYATGAGILQYEARAGDTYSLRVLANLAITVSDNVATRMLLRRLGRDNLAAPGRPHRVPGQSWPSPGNGPTWATASAAAPSSSACCPRA